MLIIPCKFYYCTIFAYSDRFIYVQKLRET